MTFRFVVPFLADNPVNHRDTAICCKIIQPEVIQKTDLINKSK